MKQYLSSLFLALLVGVAAAFFRPATPYQVLDPVVVENYHPSCTTLDDDDKSPLFCRGGASTSSSSSSLKDDGLDNPNIAEDTNITPARKCGFCIGVRIRSHLLEDQKVGISRRYP